VLFGDAEHTSTNIQMCPRPGPSAATHFRKLCCFHQRGPHLPFDGNVEERRYTTHLSVKIGELRALWSYAGILLDGTVRP
jgi:hypothetical protein